MPDVFISYSRKDKEFVRRLVKRLADQNYDVWVDFEDIPAATDWWAEICRGIEGSHTTLYVISPDSLESEYCGLELNYLLQNKKRVVPVLYRPATSQTIPPHISHIQWIDFSSEANFDQAAVKLVETINTDVEELHQLATLLVRAREWENRGHNSSLLLRGEPLEEAETFLTTSKLTDLQRQYILISRQQDIRRQIIQRFAWAFAGGLLGIGFWAFSTFRSQTLITPERLLYTISLGQTFGLCLGGMAVLVDHLPDRVERWLPDRAFGRFLLCVLFGILGWASYRWFLNNFDTTPADLNTLLLGGLGLAGGFILRLLFRWPAWAHTLLTAILIYVPIFITYSQYTAGAANFMPLVFFDSQNQVFSVAIPMAAIMAVGANAESVYREVRTFLEKRQPQLASQPGAEAAT